MRLAAIALFAASCATTPPPIAPLLPASIDVESLVAPYEPAEPKVAPDAIDFADTPVECGPGPGVLLSEKSYAESIVDRARRERAERELRALRALRAVERAGYEKAFQHSRQMAVDQAERAEKSERLQSWIFIGGVVLGGVVATGVAVAAARGTR